MQKRTIAIGIDDFKEVREGNHYLIDKSLLIKEAVEDGAKVVLLPRPRRWGKTLSMSMLRYFFEKSDQSNRHLFVGLAIEQYPEIMEHQGKYPVIFLTFKDVKASDVQTCFDFIKDVLTKLYEKHAYLLDSNILNERETKEFQELISKKADKTTYARSLHTLCTLLHRYHCIEPILIIDEYDTPILSSFENNYFPQMMDFMRIFLGMALKGNLSLKKGFMTGILRVAKESIFSGLNNVSVCTLLENKYANYFGFSESEVKAFLEYYDSIETLDQVRDWYNGYQVGEKVTMYNPWSILNYIYKDNRFLPHWMNSANNDLIKQVVQKNSGSLKADLELLIQGKTIEKEVRDFVTFNDIFNNPDVAFNFLFFTGYLSFEKRYLKGIREYFLLKIPNNEAQHFHEEIVTSWIEETFSLSNYQSMLNDLTSGNIKAFKRVFERSVEQTLSYHDVAGSEPEKFYHMFVLGMLICLQETHQIISNRESGSGRYDVMIIPKDLSKIGIIIEFKIAENETAEAFEEAVSEALEQISDKNYKAELEAREITHIINLAIVFAGKKVLVQQG